MSYLGRYSLLASENGEHAVEWFEGKSHFIVRLPDLIRFIDEAVVKNLASRKHFAKVFRLAFSGNDEEFINHPDSAILNYLNDNETTPANNINKNQLLEFNIKKLLVAYNRWQGTNLKYKEIEKLCH